MIEIFPAIDLHNGQAVRLKQGDYNQVEVFFKNPVEVLDFFNKNNSKNLHIVDLDGAKDGNTKNYEVIKELVEKSDFFVQVGGGIRDEERIKKYIELGVNRVILGTIAVENEEFLRKMVKKYGNKIAVSVDAKNEKVAVKGLTPIETPKEALYFLHLMEQVFPEYNFDELCKKEENYQICTDTITPTIVKEEKDYFVINLFHYDNDFYKGSLFEIVYQLYKNGKYNILSKKRIYIILEEEWE